jgi:hypothetical protein
MGSGISRIEVEGEGGKWILGRGSLVKLASEFELLPKFFFSLALQRQGEVLYTACT